MTTSETEPDPSDLLGREITLRNDLDRSLQLAAAKLVASPNGEAEVLKSVFADVLRAQTWIKSVAAITLDHNDCPKVLEKLAGELAPNWNHLIKRIGKNQTADWIRRRMPSLSFLDKAWVSGSSCSASPLLLSSSCFGSLEPISLFVIVEDSEVLCSSLLQSAATWTGAFLAASQRSESQARAANMIAHMSSSSVEIADFRLRLAQKYLQGPAGGDSAKAANEIELALNELADAQRALHRGLIWSSEKPRFPQPVELGQVFKDVIESLNKTVGGFHGPIVDDATLGQCFQKLQNVRVKASESRLRQSLRDAALGAWMLSERTTLKMDCETKKRRTAVTFRGQGSTIPPDWTAGQLQRNFFDPEIFCLTSQRGIVERALTFDWSQRLLAQIDAQLKPAVTDRQTFELTIDFQKCLPRS